MNHTRQKRNHILNPAPGIPVHRQKFYNVNQQCYTTEQYDKFNDRSETSYRSLRRKWAIPGNAPPSEAENQSGFIFKYVQDTDSLVPSTYEEIMQQRQLPPPGSRDVLINKISGYYMRSNPSVESQTCAIHCKANCASQSSQFGRISTRNVGCSCGIARRRRQGGVQTSVTMINNALEGNASHCTGSGCSCREEQECPMRGGAPRRVHVCETNTAYKYYTHLLFKQLSKIKSNLKKHMGGSKCTCPHYYLCRSDSGTLTPCKISPNLCENCLSKEEPKESAPNFNTESEQIASCADIVASRTCPFVNSRNETPFHIVRRDSAIETHSQSYTSTVAKYKNNDNTVESLVRTIYIQDRKEKSPIKCEASAIQASKRSDRFKETRHRPNEDIDSHVQRRGICMDCARSLSDTTISIDSK